MSLLASVAMRLADTWHQTAAHECCEVGPVKSVMYSLALAA